MVRIYNPETEEIAEIPQAELAPGMILVRLEGRGMVYCDAQQLKAHSKRGGYVYDPFDDETRGWLEEIRVSFPGVYDHSLEFWEDGFRRDQNAEREIATWHYCAERFREMDSMEWPIEKRKELFQLMMACMNTANAAAARATHHRQFLSTEEVAEFIKKMKLPP